MPILRNGARVNDPRLTRIQQFDERSRSFPITATITATKPRSYTWSCPTHLDQGNLGSCVGNGWTHELMAKPVAVKGLDEKFAVEKIYYEAQKVDEFAGGSYPGAVPYSEGSSVLAGAKVVTKLGYIKQYRWAFGVDDLIMAVGHSGPAVIGIDWLDNMFDPDKNGFIHASGPLAGGHCLLAKGVNVTNEYFLLHNSWGNSWGPLKGDAKISFKDMDFLLRRGGEACVPVVRNSSLLQSLISSFDDFINVFKK